MVNCKFFQQVTAYYTRQYVEYSCNNTIDRPKIGIANTYILTHKEKCQGHS